MEKFKYINNININDMISSSYFSDKINSYDIFEKIFDDQIKNFYKINDNNKIDSNNLYLLDFYYNHNQLAESFEDVLFYTTNFIENCVTLIYLKNSQKMFFIVKSYEMMDENNIIPFFKYYVDRDDNSTFFKEIDESFRDNETLLIISYMN